MIIVETERFYKQDTKKNEIEKNFWIGWKI